MKRLLVEINEGDNTATLSLVDESGSGVIVLRGKMGGCDFLPPNMQAQCVRVLQKTMYDNSPESIDGTD